MEFNTIKRDNTPASTAQLTNKCCNSSEMYNTSAEKYVYVHSRWWLSEIVTGYWFLYTVKTWKKLNMFINKSTVYNGISIERLSRHKDKKLERI